MRPSLALLPLLFLFLIVANVESRKYIGEKDKKLQDEIQGLMKLKADIRSENNPKIQEQHVEHFMQKCDEGSLITNTQVTIEKKVLAKDFESRPNSVYNDENVDTKETKEFANNFEPRPSASSYNPINSDFEPRPSATQYNLVNTEFEPRPSASRYNPVNSNFEHRPSATQYNPLNTEFEPRPSASRYNPVNSNFEHRPSATDHNPQ